MQPQIVLFEIQVTLEVGAGLQFSKKTATGN